MSRVRSKPDTSLLQDLPPFAAEAARRLGMDPGQLRNWSLRPDGSVVLLAVNGMKFVVAPE